MVRFLIDATFWGAVLIKERCLLERLFLCVNNTAIIRRRCLFQVRRLLEEIRHAKNLKIMTDSVESGLYIIDAMHPFYLQEISYFLFYFLT